MKHIRITLRRDSSTAVHDLFYRTTDWPERVKSAGDVSAFHLRPDDPVRPEASLEKLRDTVAHQAAQCAAEFEIEDLGGDAIMWGDDIVTS